MNDTVFVGGLYGVFLFGVLLIFRSDFFLLYRRFALRRRLADRNKYAAAMAPITRHLYYLLNTTLSRPCSPETFLGASGALLVFLLLLALRSFHLSMALPIGVFGASAPYLFLRIRLETGRRRGSMEGEKVVSELLRQYRICDKNICEALEQLITRSPDCKVCGRLLYKALLRLRNTGNPLEIREAVSMFSYAIGTNWSHMMASCIRISAERGFDISLGLEDIQIQMRMARARMEERKRLNSEAARLTLIMVPLLYLATALLSVYYLEVPLPQFVKNQVGTPEGMLLLFFILFLFLINLVLIEMVNNQKMDY